MTKTNTSKTFAFVASFLLSLFVGLGTASANEGDPGLDGENASDSWADGTSCSRKTFNRGAGVAPAHCEEGKVMDQGLCYPECGANFNGVGPVCWSTAGAAPYGRGVGTPPSCGGQTPVMDAGLCYSECAPGYKGVGNICWQQCPDNRPIDCGAACSEDETTCASLILNQISTPIFAFTQPQLTLASMLATADVMNSFNLPICGE